jgi:hypothetical protein
VCGRAGGQYALGWALRLLTALRRIKTNQPIDLAIGTNGVAVHDMDIGGDGCGGEQKRKKGF